MSRRLGPGLIALWLLLTLPVNLAVLKEVIRAAFWLAAGLEAGLDRWLWTQNLLVTIFVLWVAALLVWPMKLGRTLAVALLVGSCLAIAGFILTDLAIQNRLPPHSIYLAVMVALNLASLRALAVGKAA